MPRRSKDWYALSLAFIALVLVSLPYLIAFQAGGAQHQFGGFLFNPLDGNSYLAKMMEGWLGQWRFTLPYTAEPGKGAYLYLGYLFLGHLARLSGLSNLLVFHLARLAGAALLFYCLHRFYQTTLPNRRAVRLSFALALFGSGLGWLGALLGGFTSDFWVAEAYPFLSAFANPHFAFGLALMVWLLTLPGPDRQVLDGLKSLGTGLLLSILMPFGVVIVSITLGGFFLWTGWETFSAASGRFSSRLSAALDLQVLGRLLPVAVGGGAALLYQLWAIHSDPILAGWNTQNQTPSPSWWDFLLSFSPALLVSLVPILIAVRKPAAQRPEVQARTGDSTFPFPYPASRVLFIWTFAALVLMVFPFSLQRRFISGLFIPLAGLAALGLERLAQDRPRRYRLWAAALLLLSLPTNLLVLSAGFSGVRALDPQLYLARPEVQALEWLSRETPAGSVVLASPEMGLFIPAYSGRRVVYGHPFETVDAGERRAQVIRFFQGQPDPGLLAGVDYIFLGPRERAIGALPILPSWELVYQDAPIAIYQVRAP